MASNDLCALGIIEAGTSLNRPVPDTLSVVGYDDITLASLVWPRLTTVAQPIDEMGRAAVQFILDRLPGVQVDQHRIVFPPQLVIRESVADRS